MTTETVRAFIETLQANRLLQPDQQDELTRSLQGRFSEPRALAKYLVQRGWLTVYQVNALLQGRGKDLHLGPYRALDRLGGGGVSEVFKARDTRSGAVVALKVLNRALLSNPEAVARFQREVQVAAQLDHPNIVKALDAGQAGERYYFAMEYVEGTDLGKLVQLSGPLPVAQACEYARQAADGLQHAHAQGLVHRDIKPGNLFLCVPNDPGAPASESGLRAVAAAAPGTYRVKVLDMGLARGTHSAQGDSAQSNLTKEGRMIGTPDYLSPEQARNARGADARADVYSLGCTLYYLLTAQPPFPGGSLMQKLFHHQRTEPPSALRLRPELPPELDAVLLKMMAKQPGDRYPTAAAVVEALAPFCRVNPSAAALPRKPIRLTGRLGSGGPPRPPEGPG